MAIKIKPPANPKFFSKEMVCIWLEKSKWKINAVDIQNKAKR